MKTVNKFQTEKFEKNGGSKTRKIAVKEMKNRKPTKENSLTKSLETTLKQLDIIAICTTSIGENNHVRATQCGK